MKQIKKDKLSKQDEKTLLEETEILKEMDHPNIVKLFEIYRDGHNYYLITEYCPGGELMKKLQKDKILTEHSAAKYMRQLFSAVQYCHAKGIVHRDLKLENLLLENHTDKAHLKVIDFGASERFDGVQKLQKKIGTPYYIAREVLGN